MSDEYTCPKCKERISAKDLRADKNGSGWICVTCYNNQHKKPIRTSMPTTKVFTENDTFVQPPTRKTIQRQTNLEREIKYYCTSCKYKFSKKFEYIGRCPYCDKPAVRKEVSSNELLREIDDLIE